MGFRLSEDKLVYKGFLFSRKEISASDIEKIVDDAEGAKVYLKSGKVLSDKYAINPIFNEVSYFVKNNVSYENMKCEKEAFTALQLQEMFARTREKSREIASRMVKEKMGDDYDVSVEIVGEPYYSLLIFRLVERGMVLDAHPLYEEIGELGVDYALCEMDLSYLISWDSVLMQGTYGVTVEVQDEVKLKDYIEDCISYCFEHNTDTLK